MRFEQTREILRHIRDFHQSLSHCYQGLEDKAGRERVKLLLDYMGERESDLAEAVEAFMEEAEPEVLDTWFQFADESVYLKLACPVIDPSEDTAVEDVLALAQEAHECLMKAYQEIIANCDMQRVCDVFQNLLDEGQREWKALMRNTQLMSDL